jgi:hypothetical protein
MQLRVVDGERATQERGRHDEAAASGEVERSVGSTRGLEHTARSKLRLFDLAAVTAGHIGVGAVDDDVLGRCTAWDAETQPVAVGVEDADLGPLAEVIQMRCPSGVNRRSCAM